MREALVRFESAIRPIRRPFRVRAGEHRARSSTKRVALDPSAARLELAQDGSHTWQCSFRHTRTTRTSRSRGPRRSRRPCEAEPRPRSDVPSSSHPPRRRYLALAHSSRPRPTEDEGAALASARQGAVTAEVRRLEVVGASPKTSSRGACAVQRGARADPVTRRPCSASASRRGSACTPGRRGTRFDSRRSTVVPRLSLERVRLRGVRDRRSCGRDVRARRARAARRRRHADPPRGAQVVAGRLEARARRSTRRSSGSPNPTVVYFADDSTSHRQGRRERDPPIQDAVRLDSRAPSTTRGSRSRPREERLGAAQARSPGRSSSTHKRRRHLLNARLLVRRGASTEHREASTRSRPTPPDRIWAVVGECERTTLEPPRSDPRLPGGIDGNPTPGDWSRGRRLQFDLGDSMARSSRIAAPCRSGGSHPRPTGSPRAARVAMRPSKSTTAPRRSRLTQYLESREPVRPVARRSSRCSSA